MSKNADQIRKSLEVERVQKSKPFWQVFDHEDEPDFVLEMVFWSCVVISYILGCSITLWILSG